MAPILGKLPALCSRQRTIWVSFVISGRNWMGNGSVLPTTKNGRIAIPSTNIARGARIRLRSRWKTSPATGRLRNIILHDSYNQETLQAMITLKEGDKAPAFTGIDAHGNKISLADYKGKRVALYFYPEDDTPTCTVQACNLRDNFSLLRKE